MRLSISQSKKAISWEYKGRHIEIQKYNISEAKYIEKEQLILLFYQINATTDAYLSGYNLDGSERFQIKSNSHMEFYRFSSHLDDKIMIVGCVKENDDYTDYHFGVNPKDGALTQYGRAY
jgi:hypothetical protein